MITITQERISKLQKWVQNYIQETRSDAAIKSALRITEGAARDLDIPAKWGEISKGWDYNSYLNSPSVDKACSSSINHGDGWEKTNAQCPRRLFSTRLLALKELRREVELKAARILAGIDIQIEDEKSKENKP